MCYILHRGTWRTMLSDEPVCEAKMVRGSRPFNFTMEEEQEQVKREQTEALGRRAPVLREKKKRKSPRKYKLGYIPLPRQLSELCEK